MRQIFLLLLILTGCLSSARDQLSVTDDLDRTIYVPPRIERVAPLAPNITELLFAAGAGSKVAGVSTVDDFPAAVDSLPRYGLIPTDFEAIVALDVDLILASEQVNSPQDADIFAAVGIPVYFVAVNTLGDVTRVIRDLGDLLGTSEFAHERATQLEDSLSLLRTLTSDLTTKPDVLFLINPVTLYGFGQGSYIHDMVDLAGGHSITQHLSIRFPLLTDEFVLAAGPEVIAGAFGLQFENPHLLLHHPTWDILPAVQQDRIYGLNPDLYLRPGPRLVKGTWELARVLQPDAGIQP